MSVELKFDYLQIREPLLN